MLRSKKTGEELRALRKSKGVQSKFVAEALGLSSAYLSDLEHGRRYWTLERIYAYKKALGIDVDLTPDAPTKTAVSMLQHQTKKKHRSNGNVR